jgi:hypothetical protein
MDNLVSDNEYVLTLDNGQYIGNSNSPDGHWDNQNVNAHDDPREARRFATPDEAVAWGLKNGWVSPGSEIKLRSIPKHHRYDDSGVREGFAIALTPRNPQYSRLAEASGFTPEESPPLYIKDTDQGLALVENREEATIFATEEDEFRYARANGLMADHGPITTIRIGTRLSAPA